MTQFKNNLEAVKRARIEFEKELEDDENNQWLKDIIEELKETEKGLEVLKIIKKKGVSFMELALIVSCKSYEEYCIEMKSNRVYLTSYECMETLKTQEEFDLLKEELLWD